MAAAARQHVFRIAIAFACAVARKGRDTGFGTVGTGRDGGDERGGGGLGGNALKMNFSVGVSMYNENVTSYW